MAKSNITKKWIKTKADKLAVKSGCWFDIEAAEHVCKFFTNYLKLSKGKWAGKPFQLMKWQREELLMPLFGWKRKDGTRRFRVGYVEIPKKNGKALALDTPIPTHKGWTTMGEIQPGEIIFDELGKPCQVVAATGVMEKHDCYLVTFSDGTSVVADADHQWRTHTRKPENHFDVWTTKQIAESLWLDYGKSAGYNHSIRLERCLATPAVDLLIDPYVLGAWLGDGTSKSASITISYEDAELVEILRATGARVEERKSNNITTGCYAIDPGKRGVRCPKTMTYKLRKLGVLKNKHIPPQYQRASKQQRLALLQGLMDTDGFASKAGQCEFTTTSEALRDGFLELARGLGYKPTLKTARATINGKDCGLKYRIQFWAFHGSPVFRLTRKLMRMKPKPNGRARSKTVHIISVTLVPSVPVRCIQVDSPSSLFLCGEGMIPTHNSGICSGLSLYLASADGEQGAEVYNAAADRQQADIVFSESRNMVKASRELSKYAKVTDSKKRIDFPDSNSFIRVISSEAYTAEGLNIHGLIFDELHAQKTRELWDALRYGGAAREQPLLLSITTAGWDTTSICYEQHEYAKKVLSGEIDDYAFFGLIYAADKDDEPLEPETWHKANPSIGETISESDMAQAAKEASASPVKLNAFKRYRLNIWTEQADRWLSADAWAKCSDVKDAIEWRNQMLEELAGQSCFAGLDLGSTSDLTALVLFFPEKNVALPWFWLPEDAMQDKHNPNRDTYRTWAGQEFLTTTLGNVCDYDKVRADINDIAEKFTVQELAVDRLFQGAQLCTQLQQDGFDVVAFGQGFVSMAAPCKEFDERVLSARFNHGNNPVLNWMAGNVAVATDPAGNMKPIKPKRNSPYKIDGIVAAIMALGRAMQNQEEESDFDGEIIVL